MTQVTVSLIGSDHEIMESKNLLILFTSSGTQGYNNVPPCGPVLPCGLSLAPQDLKSPISCRSTITVFCHVVFGCPGLLLLGGVHLMAT